MKQVVDFDQMDDGQLADFIKERLGEAEAGRVVPLAEARARLLSDVRPSLTELPPKASR